MTFPSPLTLCNTASFLTRSVQLIWSSTAPHFTFLQVFLIFSMPKFSNPTFITSHGVGNRTYRSSAANNSSLVRLLGCHFCQQATTFRKTVVPFIFSVRQSTQGWISWPSRSAFLNLCETAGPVNSFLIRRETGPNRFTRKYLSNFF